MTLSEHSFTLNYIFPVVFRNMKPLNGYDPFEAETVALSINDLKGTNDEALNTDIFLQNGVHSFSAQ